MSGPYFEIHIRPMFRLTDRDHMLFSFDLFDYEEVVKHQDDIKELVLDGSMPPRSTGGPWPEEWGALFQRWIDTGSQRLVLVSDATYSLTRNGDMLTLTGTGTFAGQFTAWFERVASNSSTYEYTFYRTPGPAGPDRPFKILEKSIPGTEGRILVNDAQGQHLVTL